MGEAREYWELHSWTTPTEVIVVPQYNHVVPIPSCMAVMALAVRMVSACPVNRPAVLCWPDLLTKMTTYIGHSKNNNNVESFFIVEAGLKPLLKP